MEYPQLASFSRQFALVWFFVLFVAILVWAFWPGNKKRFEREGQKILEEDDALPPS
ncbi:MAG: cbb3-type cytochrome c oxidase subunit 3 [Magnetococcales bacterium]|nr:cbb3-type cytochrome c oxidase subunit 3 [Magnetococcales bacterium]